MSKFLLNLLLQISKALVNSKIQFSIQKPFFLAFGPAITTPHLALNRSLLSPQLLLTERRRLPILHHHRPASTAPPELR
jgi:hypothetical protein